jgi:chromosome partitioning protein
MIITFMNGKGGAGKTTLATNIGKGLKNRGYTVLLVDADIQGSARDWHEASEGTELEVLGLDRPTIDKDIERFKSEYDFILIDSGSRLQEMITKCIKCSDAILIPAQPSPYDIWASRDVVDLIKARQEVTNGLPLAAFVVSRQKERTKIGRKFREVVQEYELEILDHGTYDRTVYATSAAQGKAVIDTGNEIEKSEMESVLDDLLDFVKYGRGIAMSEQSEC